MSTTVKKMVVNSVVANGLVVERPMTRAEAADELSRRALRRWMAGEFSTLREAIYAAMDDDPQLKHIYATR
jgi:hypothetical protein